MTTDRVTLFTFRESASVILIAIVAGSIPALQPLVLGGLLAEGRLTTAQIGQAATLEAMGMAISATLAAAFLVPRHLRAMAAGVATIALCANLLTTVTSGFGIVAARGLNGLCSGLMLWLVVGLFARAEVPGRVFAIYVTAQALSAFLLSALFTTIVLPRFGATGAYITLALINIPLLIASTQIPRAYRIIEGAAGGGMPPARGVIGLVGVLLYIAGILSLWVYVAPLLKSKGHDPVLIGYAITAALGVQILAGLSASVLATKFRAAPTCIIGALVSIACIAVLLVPAGAVTMFAAMAVFAFAWMFVPPFQMPFLIEIDPTLKTAMLISGAQLFGGAVGPMLSSTAASVIGLDAVGAVAMALFAGSALCVLVSRRMPASVGLRGERIPASQ